MNTSPQPTATPWILPCGAAFALLILLIGSVRIAPPDLAFYYSYADSLLHDLDFAFANQFDQFPFAVHELYQTRTGFPANDWPMGTGIAWLPFLALGSALASIGSALGWITTDTARMSVILWCITYGSTLLYGFGTLVVSWFICRRYVSSQNACLWALGGIALGSSLTYHLLVNTADSHPPSAFFVGLFLLLWLRWTDSHRLTDALLAGLCIGMAALIRPHNAIFILTPLLHIWLIAAPPKHVWLRSGAVLAASSFLVFLPQLIVWQTLYGNPLELPRSSDVLWLQPHLFEMLFSDFHGMISWSPLFGLAMLGLCVQRKTLPLLIPLLLVIYIYSCNIAWWAGGSFGNRRMVSFAPVFVLGLAMLLHHTPKAWMKGLLIACGGWTFCLLLSEVGGTLPLDRYLRWHEIIETLPAGVPLGIMRFFTIADWSVSRIVVALLLCGGFGLAYWTRNYWATPKRLSITMGTLAVALVIASSIAGMRTAEDNRSSNMNIYPPYDRFTWLIYFEKGFYHLQNYDYDTALDCYIAATILEPRHPQPSMYIAYIADDHGWDNVAYQYYRQALRFGGRTQQFFFRYEDQLRRRIRSGGDALPQLLNERGVLLAVQNEYDAAEADFRQALRFDPEYELPLRNLDVLEKRRAGESARLLWE